MHLQKIGGASFVYDLTQDFKWWQEKDQVFREGRERRVLRADDPPTLSTIHQQITTCPNQTMNTHTSTTPPCHSRNHKTIPHSRQEAFTWLHRVNHNKSFSTHPVFLTFRHLLVAHRLSSTLTPFPRAARSPTTDDKLVVTFLEFWRLSSVYFVSRPPSPFGTVPFLSMPVGNLQCSV